MDKVTRRPAATTDLELLYRIRREALEPYVVQTFGVWDETVQRKRFNETTRVETLSILELDGEPIGSLSLKQSNGEIELGRLFILPPFQNRGIGTGIMREVVEMAVRAGLAIRLSVLKVNPARRLYERFGFIVSEETETHYVMVRPATT